MFLGRRFYLLGLLLSLVLLHSTTYAQRPDAPTYAQRGPYVVGTAEYLLEDKNENEDAERPLKLSVWYPALNPDALPVETTYQENIVRLEGQALRDAPADLNTAPYPLIVFSHGSGGFRYQSLFLTEHLASHGFVVMAADHPGNTVFDQTFEPNTFSANILANYALRPLDILRIINFAADLNTDDALLAGLLDMEAVAVMGHSFGGYTALSNGGAALNLAGLRAACEGNDELGFCRITTELTDFGQTLAELRGLEAEPAADWPLTTDPRIQAIVMFAPAGAATFSSESLNAITLPSLFLVGSEDRTTPAERDTFVLYEAIGSEDKILGVFESAGHYIFVDECSDIALSFGFFSSCSDLVWDMKRAHDLINHLTTAFLLETLWADAEAAAALNPDTVDFVGLRYERIRE